MADLNKLVAAVKAHASANYNKDGWDNIVECWGDEDIQQAILVAKDEEAAIHTMWQIARQYRQREDDVMCQSGEHVKCPKCEGWIYIDDLERHNQRNCG